MPPSVPDADLRGPPIAEHRTAAPGVDVRAVLAALAEPRRADIMRLLERRHRSQRGLSSELGMSQPLLSHHLKVLREAALIDSTVCDRVKVYLLRPETLKFLADRLAVMAEAAAETCKIKPC
jgi:DNA-binding transcriptional ArsR family regulator